MIFGISLSTIIELVLAALLAPTLYCCVTLERRLRNLRKDQETLNATVRALNQGVAAAHTSLAGLRAAAAEADKTLGVKVSAARLLVDELSVLSASGERIASRMENARETPRVLRPAQPASAEGLRAVR
jgi:uncharacterized protein DUF6468